MAVNTAPTFFVRDGKVITDAESIGDVGWYVTLQKETNDED